MAVDTYSGESVNVVDYQGKILWLKYDLEHENNQIIYWPVSGSTISPSITSGYPGYIVSNTYDMEKGYGTITMSEDITTIPQSAFTNFAAYYIRVPDSVTYIGRVAFDSDWLEWVSYPRTAAVFPDSFPRQTKRLYDYSDDSYYYKQTLSCGDLCNKYAGLYKTYDYYTEHPSWYNWSEVIESYIYPCSYEAQKIEFDYYLNYDKTYDLKFYEPHYLLDWITISPTVAKPGWNHYVVNLRENNDGTRYAHIYFSPEDSLPYLPTFSLDKMLCIRQFMRFNESHKKIDWGFTSGCTSGNTSLLCDFGAQVSSWDQTTSSITCYTPITRILGPVFRNTTGVTAPLPNEIVFPDSIESFVSTLFAQKGSDPQTISSITFPLSLRYTQISEWLVNKKGALPNLRTCGPVGGNYNVKIPRWKATVSNLFDYFPLESVVLPDSIIYISDDSFIDIQEIHIPASVISLGSSALYRISNVYFYGAPPIYYDSDSIEVRGTTTIHCHSQYLSAFQSWVPAACAFVGSGASISYEIIE